MTHRCEIVCFRHDDAPLLADFFQEIASDPASRHFHPHPFTQHEAQRICRQSGADHYLGLRVGGKFTAYGMLRGWDEGYTVPSLGLYVAAGMRGTGAARLLMEHMHLIARLNGASQVRLKVYTDNFAATRLYESLGYVWQSEMGPPTPQKLGLLQL